MGGKGGLRMPAPDANAALPVMPLPSHPLQSAAPVVWFTGLSGAGKSTLAEALCKAWQTQGRAVIVLDGDRLRSGLCNDLGFSDADRRENMRRATEVARLASDAGVATIVAMISPFANERAAARERLRARPFFEVHVHAPLQVAEARDPKGLYLRARRGEIPQFTGIDSPYEAPQAPELRLDTHLLSEADCLVALLTLTA